MLSCMLVSLNCKSTHALQNAVKLVYSGHLYGPPFSDLIKQVAVLGRSLCTFLIYCSQNALTDLDQKNSSLHCIGITILGFSAFP